jgi:CubicO group peptidase (beta-lactamase class C family)
MKRWCAALSMLALASVGQAHSPGERLAGIVNDPALPLSSAAVVAIRDGKVVWSGQAGCKRFEAGRCVAAAPGDLYRVASVSKMVTALGVLRMVEQGTLDLDRDISLYLGYQVRHPDFSGAALTLRRLLTHTSGLTDQAGYRLAPSGDMRTLLAGAGPQWDGKHAPGAYFRYANLNFGVIASVMERASGERFDRLMERLVLQPLGLHGGFNPAALADRAALATLYRKDKDNNWQAQVDAPGSFVDPAPQGYIPGANGTLYSPQGGLRISALDLGAIVQMLVDGGEWKGKPFLAPATLRELLRPHWRSNGRNGDEAGGLFKAWGLGVQLYEDSKVLRGAGHLGDAWGLLSGVAFDPASRSGVVYIIGGMGVDPSRAPGRLSPLAEVEERLLALAYSQVSPQP